MHKLRIFSIGAPHEDWQREAIHSFCTRLSPFAQLEVKELPDGAGGSAKPDPNRVREKEAESLRNALSGIPYIALDERGKNLSSAEWAELVKETAETGQTIGFVIGGAWGLDETIRNNAVKTVSFGKQTAPHILARILLLEQLYRAETILKGKEYHK
ncbi:23S rRNA (pseudouridine(1915)-N(3))-methyltransferase RlmH [Patescibacteria group bacterium]|jgi:23S rRNA (pseudouridine1915-N3)-methyltransferase|nr:23S rRNA (pseudouridine(1915)-N(3))-methyltransferase RlmH [Patescibacteria group bacterium]MBP7006276.1 23S rRNA (pseudouridine(1915)-N(3))-methyltransferase RlmH [Patescibacteria group bacterium]